MDELINRENPQKLYVQLEEIIKKKIEDKEWAVGSQIPTEEDLCRTYGVSKATVRAAISELARQGYLMRQQGKGTYVCERVIFEGPTMLTSFSELMLESGIDFSTEVLAQTGMMPTDGMDEKLNMPADKHLIYIKRLRKVDKEPVLLQETFIPHQICPSLLNEDIANKSLFELLEKEHGIKITVVDNFIDLIYPSPEECRILGIPGGAPALFLEQHFYSGGNKIMYMRSIKRPDRFRFSVEFARKQTV